MPDDHPRPNPRRVLLEVCVESAADAGVAVRGGADRLELNSALALDGLTPPAGLLADARRAAGPRVPIITMARPRAGDFCYAEDDYRSLLRDVESLLAGGADGIAFGILTADGSVDVARCEAVTRLLNTSGAGRIAVFHRAFDRVRNPLDALEQLIDLGVRRVMTSGQQPTALQGADLIAQLVRRAAGRIEILPAGGVRPANAEAILARTGCDQLHSSLRDAGAERLSPRLLGEMSGALRRP